MLDELKFNPIPIPSNGGVITYTDVKSTIKEALYAPNSWPLTSELIYYVQTRNATVLGSSEVYSTVKSYGLSASLTSSSNEVESGIRCSDKAASASMSDVLPYSNVRASLSRIASDGANTDMRCAQWNKKMYAKERYTGDFDVKTPHPVLVLSNRYDPSTPLAAAKNLTATFEGSVLLEQNGYGVRVSWSRFIQSAPLIRLLVIAHYPVRAVSLYGQGGPGLLFQWHVARGRDDLRDRCASFYEPYLCGCLAEELSSGALSLWTMRNFSRR